VAPAKVGRATETEKEGVQKPQGVGPAHSTLRTGEPFTWGRELAGRDTQLVKETQKRTM
jgi:hypothetical protein